MSLGGRLPRAASGVAEGLAVMLSVVVFGLGVAALVARQELALPDASVLALRSAAAHAASPSRPVLPSVGVAR